MSEPIIKAYDSEVKDFNESERSFWATASVEIEDRDGDIIEVKGIDIKNFKKNPVFLYAHNYSDLPIGKVKEIEKADGKLRFKPEFAPASVNPFAEQVYQSFRGGFIKAFSIGFIPQEWSANEKQEGDGVISRGRRYKKTELLEISACPVPSNPQALAELRALGMKHNQDADFMLKLKNQLDLLVSILEKEKKPESEPAPVKIEELKNNPIIIDIVKRLDRIESGHNDPVDIQPPAPVGNQPDKSIEAEPAGNVQVLSIGSEDLKGIVKSMIDFQVEKLKGKI